jgi:DNA invertase Pin-like site-specific DNA recombinase
MTQVSAVFAELERKLIGERTKAALAQKKAAGVRLGRPRSLPAPVVARVAEARARGLTLRAIADELNRDGVPTAHGGTQWWAETVRGVLRSVECEAEHQALTGQ